METIILRGDSKSNAKYSGNLLKNLADRPTNTEIKKFERICQKSLTTFWKPQIFLRLKTLRNLKVIKVFIG